jgi:hypothetical protein
MKLTDLNPRWIGTGGEGISDKDGNPVPYTHGVAIMFDCPCGCKSDCVIEFEPTLESGPSPRQDGHVWHREGDTFETLTLTPSIQRVGGCAWHGFITNGEVKAA